MRPLTLLLFGAALVAALFPTNAQSIRHGLLSFGPMDFADNGITPDAAPGNHLAPSNLSAANLVER